MTGVVAVLEKEGTINSELVAVFMREHINDCVSFIEGVKRGLKDYREGKLILWTEVKKELGYG